MKYFRKLVGDYVYLSPVSFEDTEKYVEWLCDMEVVKYLDVASTNIDLNKEKEILEKLTKNNVILGIINKETNLIIGNVGLHNIDHIHAKAELGIFIGNKNYWNRGFGTEAVKLMLDYGFNVLNLENIHLRVMSYNFRALKSYQKIGFIESGKLRSAYKLAGKRYDIIFMDILAEEYQSIYLKQLFESDEHEKNYGAKLQIIE